MYPLPGTPQWCGGSGSGGRAPRASRVAADRPRRDTVRDMHRPAATPPEGASTLDAHVLVVDDERDITALVAYHLAKAGYRVTTAGTGIAALEAVAAEPPDLVVLDLMLPGRSGYEVLGEIRRREETRDAGVIVLTARRDEADRI